MSDIRNSLFLTNDEVDRIHAWTQKNNFSLRKGHFSLFFDFCPIFEDPVIFTADQEGEFYLLDLRDDYSCNSNVAENTPEHERNFTITLDNVTVELTISDEALGKFLGHARASTEAHLEEDCEPCGSGLGFEIHENCCNVFAGSRLLEKRPVNRN